MVRTRKQRNLPVEQHDQINLQRLATFMAPALKQARPDPDRKPFTLRNYKNLKEMDLRQMFFLRHGSHVNSTVVVHSYLFIAKRLHIPVSTCFTALKKYKEHGLVFV